jgi:hypothetical protein
MNDDRSLKELVSGLARDTGLLVRQEVALAKAELRQKVAAAGKVAAVFAAGALLAYGGLLVLLAGVVLVLITAGVAAWLAALAVGTAGIAAGFVLVQGARRGLARADLAPRHTKAARQLHG